MSAATDDLMSVEGDLIHLNTLIDVVTDMTIDASAALSKGASPSDRAALNSLGHLMWIVRDLTAKVRQDMEKATARLVREQKAEHDRMTGGQGNG